jgi:AcrR family transcriptional regulator
MVQTATVAARDTKERILDAAERLFADFGFDGTSMRAVTGEAKVNLAAAHYHFGSKEALLSAVLARRFDPINRQRLEMLDRLEARDPNPTIDDLLRAFFEPAFREISALGETGIRFVQLAGRMHSAANARVRSLFLQRFKDVIARFVPAFHRALPGLSPGDLHWKVHFLVGAMAHVLAFSPHDDCVAMLGAGGFDPSEALEALLKFCAAGMRAPGAGVRAG